MLCYHSRMYVFIHIHRTILFTLLSWKLSSLTFEIDLFYWKQIHRQTMPITTNSYFFSNIYELVMQVNKEAKNSVNKTRNHNRWLWYDGIACQHSQCEKSRSPNITTFHTEWIFTLGVSIRVNIFRNVCNKKSKR